jgi:hypothetical protein
MEFRLQKKGAETMKELRASSQQRYSSYSTDHWEVIDDLNRWAREIGVIDIEKQSQQDYNVAVYRILPYPPFTKDMKDFFIQKD